MNSRRLSRKFYTRETLIIAQELLGKFLVRKIGKKKMIGKIVETEAYIGPKDRASHTYGGKVTKRNESLYLTGGYVYIYLCYGIHWQFNVTTNIEEKPECVLIRALEPIGRRERKEKIASGPGKLSKWMRLDRDFNKEDLTKSKRLWLEERNNLIFGNIKKSQIIATQRIGIDYAGAWAKKPWRFYIKENPFISRK